ncbi:MAG: NAD(P)/FAD-dependent oxidoreductase [Lachnospiraceae bacterium]
MIRLQQIKLPIDHTEEALKKKIIKTLRIEEKQLKSYRIHKQSIDARKKPELFYSYTIDAEVKKETEVLKRVKVASKVTDKCYTFPDSGDMRLPERPVIAGAGPAGLFCAYALAKHGYAPIVIERGKKMEDRVQDVETFWKTGVLNPDSNVQFGEGGAGTFSDGKLNTLVKDKFGRNRKVLDLFIQMGAPKQIGYESKPHIGTDLLHDVIRNLRNEILTLGGEFYFETCLKDIRFQQNQISEIVVEHKGAERVIPTQVLVLAIGHSARDTFAMLHDRAVPMEAKAFAVGLRVEHPQRFINETQYGTTDRKLPAAPYKLTAKAKNGRGVYSFCMCPGGYVVNASSEPKHLAVNGMSYFDRDSANANSAIIVAVTPKDYPTDGPLAGIVFQRELEARAYELANGAIPQQLYGDFKENKESVAYGSFDSCAKGKTTFANLRGLFSDSISEAFIDGMESFQRQIPNFNCNDAILSGVESRTSSPVRIWRDESFESEKRGLYPCGEGAGYAGGIMSAAMDGLKVAEAIARKYQCFHLGKEE